MGHAYGCRLGIAVRDIERSYIYTNGVCLPLLAVLLLLMLLLLLLLA